MKPKRSKRANTIANLSEKQKDRFRAQNAEQLGDRRVCPTPTKVAFPTRRAAKQTGRKLAMQGSRGRIHAYACVCGCFHLGTASTKPPNHHPLKEDEDADARPHA